MGGRGMTWDEPHNAFRRRTSQENSASDTVSCSPEKAPRHVNKHQMGQMSRVTERGSTRANEKSKAVRNRIGILITLSALHPEWGDLPSPTLVGSCGSPNRTRPSLHQMCGGCHQMMCQLSCGGHLQAATGLVAVLGDVHCSACDGTEEILLLRRNVVLVFQGYWQLGGNRLYRKVMAWKV